MPQVTYIEHDGVRRTVEVPLGENVMRGVPAVGASAVIVTGAAITFTLLAAVQGELALPDSPAGWGVAVAFALFPTMIAISLFLAGLPRIGAARASLISTWEPVVTVVLAVILFGDTFTFVQMIGGVLILLAVILQAGPEGGRAADAAPVRN